MINGDKMNPGKWKIAIIRNTFMGKDNTIRSIGMCTGKSVIELSYPIELHCDSTTTPSNTQDDKTLNDNAQEFQETSQTIKKSERHLVCIIKSEENNVEISRSRTI